MANCTNKHTRYQPSNEEWLCPECGADNNHFWIEDTPNGDCELIHVDDLIVCSKCGLEKSGNEVIQMMIKKKSLVTCPCCKGKGMVKK